MTDIITGITFSPVQTFIEKSRKLRDLYGSSYLLSYLSWSICHAAQCHKYTVISPALHNLTQGMPNKILINGDFAETEARAAFLQAWECVTDTCQTWVEQQFPTQKFLWKRDWGLWTNYAWEFFWVQGNSISDVRRQLEAKKQSRDWVGINWQGESSSLSGTDAVAHPNLGATGDPRKLNVPAQKRSIEAFYERLSRRLGEGFIDPDEELSIPELTKRLITFGTVAEAVVKNLKTRLGEQSTDSELEQLLAKIKDDLKPGSFKDLNRLAYKKRRVLQADSASQPEIGRWTGWFHGDGDRAGNYLDTLDVAGTRDFSEQMRQWGNWFQAHPPQNCRVIYAGGDDFLGIFYRTAPDPLLEPQQCIDYFCQFKSETWNTPTLKPITPSVGFVWAAPSVPQRDVLQHCREAEKAAKDNGRDRIALRVLFNGGNYLEWVCPWRFLSVLQQYRDRHQNSKPDKWTHFYNDVATLEARHAFEGNQIDVALALFKVYFGESNNLLNQENWWNSPAGAGILGECKNYVHPEEGELDFVKVHKALNEWLINLAKVGFHLCSDT